MLSAVVSRLEILPELRVVGIRVLQALQKGSGLWRLVEIALDERKVESRGCLAWISID